MMYWYTADGYADAVIEVEKTPTCVYVRKNIERVEETDPLSGQMSAHWRYKEAKMSDAEYDLYEETKSVVSDALEQEGVTQILDALLTGGTA